MREVKDQKWYKRLKAPKPEAMPLMAEARTYDPPMMEIENEADRSLRRMKEGKRRLGQ